MLEVRCFRGLLSDEDLKQVYFKEGEFVLAGWREMSVQDMKAWIRCLLNRLYSAPGMREQLAALGTKEEIMREYGALAYVPWVMADKARCGVWVPRQVRGVGARNLDGLALTKREQRCKYACSAGVTFPSSARFMTACRRSVAGCITTFSVLIIHPHPTDAPVIATRVAKQALALFGRTLVIIRLEDSNGVGVDIENLHASECIQRPQSDGTVKAAREEHPSAPAHRQCKRRFRVTAQTSHLLPALAVPNPNRFCPTIRRG